MAGWCSSPGRRASASRRWSSSCSATCRDASWFWGACDGLFTPRPLGPLFDIAAKLGGELLELCRADAPRADLFSALLRQVSEPGELRVLVVEDIHWADEATIDLLRFLGRRIRDANVLLIVTYRDESLGATDPLRIALGDLATQRSVRRIGLAPLSAGAVRVLAGDQGLDAAALYRLTGGNPFYVTEVVQSGMGEIPASARDAVLARVSRLSAGAREVLDAAALIGARVEFPLLTSVSEATRGGRGRTARVGAAQPGTAPGPEFPARDRPPRRWQEAIPPLRSGLIHARILRALPRPGLRRRRPAGLPRGGGRGRPGGAALRPRRRPPGGRAGLPPRGRRPVRAGAAVRRRAGSRHGGRALRWAGRGAGAAGPLAGRGRRAGAGAGPVASGRRPAAEGAALRRLSRTMWRLCRGQEARAAAEAAVSLLEPLGPSAELAWAYANLGSRRMDDGQYEVAVALTRRAEAIAESLGVAEVLSEALNTQGCALACLG